MSKPMGQADFFELEAGEYLEKLSRLLVPDAAPRSNELLRYSRALRGAALMASQADFAEAAGALEAVARAYREGKLEWSREVYDTLSRAASEMSGLVPGAGNWSSAHAEKASRVARELERLSGEPAPVTITPPSARRATDSGDRLNAGVRAFVAREGALIASALDRASRALASNPGDRETVHNVVRRMQSLRGLAELTDLSPLPEMLDALEQVAADLGRSATAPPPDLKTLFGNAAGAMTRAARDVADSGKPRDPSDEVKQFVNSVVGAFAIESDVVPIERLAPDGADPIAEPGRRPADPEALGTSEAVTLGEHLTRLAREVAGARSDNTRRLRFYLALAALRNIEKRLSGKVQAAFESLSRRVMQLLSAAGDLGAEATEEVSRSLVEIGAMFRGAEETAGATEPPAPAEPASDLPLAGTPKREEEAPIPAGNIAATARPAAGETVPPVPIESLAPDTDQPVVARAFEEYRRLSSAPAPEPSIEGLVGTAPQVAPASPRRAAEQLPLVEIGQLVYSGERALQRAMDLGRQITSEMSRGAQMEQLRPLIAEVIDLMPLVAGGRPAR